MGRLRFSKMHGAGNDFVVVDRRAGGTPLTADFIARLCDRHYGIGCDQLLTVETDTRVPSGFGYGIYNADGGTARQCGNGARCVAAWLWWAGAVTQSPFELGSPSGPVAVERLADGRFRVFLSVPDFRPPAVPLLALPADSYTVETIGERIEFEVVSLGNPHVLIRVSSVTQAPVARWGAVLQASPLFPDSCNAGFAEVVNTSRLRLRVFERGVGETLACGSAACAAAVLSIRRGQVQSPVTVEMPGGLLEVSWNGPGTPVALAGPAEFVFEGEMSDERCGS